MAKQIIWSPNARDSLDEIFLALSEKHEQVALSWIYRVFTKIELLENFPEIGVMIPEKQINFIREIYIGNYKIAYSYLSEIITILKIVRKGSPFGKL